MIMKLIRQRGVLDPERRAILSLRFVPASGALVDIAFGLELMHFSADCLLLQFANKQGIGHNGS